MASVVAAFSDMDPSPRAVIDVDPADLLAGTVSVTIWQLSTWGQVPVRNAVRRTVAGGLLVTDYEIPPGGRVTYRVEQFDASGVSLGFALSLSAEVVVPPGWVVVSDPLAPRNAVRLRAEARFAEGLTRTRPTAIYQAGGRTFAMTGVYSALQKVVLRCVTTSEAERSTLAAILAESVICVRSERMRLPGAFFATVDTVPMIPWDARVGGDTDVWDIAGDEVTRPVLDVIVAVYSYQAFREFLDRKYPPRATYRQAATEWATYIDALRNPPPLA
ncbi:hypothetical protein [Agromyces larvae]|uniref:Minor tail protein n=1 Tax=Agromyces larvae TaxID=2929802 RepID=A0ABY4C273_9MICO|nr:hypothetical protein [Agromyces larvae]UOE45468.1 hypothetical protein MTO99_06845 [Agromyces larvae]